MVAELADPQLLTPNEASERRATPEPLREIRHQFTPNLPDLLAPLRASLLISTYQAGKVVVVGVDNGRLVLSYHNFEKAMGLAIGTTDLVVGTNAQIWFLHHRPDLAPQLEPVGRRDACFVARRSHYTGEIQSHELAWSGDELWIVNTAFSSLCTVHPEHSFDPRWQPKFISQLAAEDRCHLNGLAMLDGQPKYVSVLSETDTAQGWRAHKANGGCLIDVPSNEIVARGFAMPHSPRVHGGNLFLLNSGEGRLVVVDPATGNTNTVAQLPGYTRGLALRGRYAFVGLSKIRESSTFGGVPIAEHREMLKCGVGVVDLTTGRLAAYLEFVTGIEEIFDVQLLAGSSFPVVSGPFPTLDGTAPIWTVPIRRPAGSS